MTAFSCTPPNIPHIERFELDMLMPSVFEAQFPEIKLASNRVIATTALGAVLSVKEYGDLGELDEEDEYLSEAIKLGLHDGTLAEQIIVYSEESRRPALQKLNYLRLSPVIVEQLGERFGFVGDMYKPVYCGDHSGSNKAIGAQHYAGHLAKEEPEFPMAFRYKEHVRHDAALSDHILGTLTIDSEARGVHGARINDNLASNPSEVIADAHAFDYLTADVGQPLFYKLTDTDRIRIIKNVDNSYLGYVCKIIMNGDRKFTFALSRFTEYPLPNVLTVDIEDELVRIALETQRALKRSGLPDMRHHGLSEQTKAILEMAERVAYRTKKMGRVIASELEAGQLQNQK